MESFLSISFPSKERIAEVVFPINQLLHTVVVGERFSIIGMFVSEKKILIRDSFIL
jgi:hypothetical protein